MKRITTLCVTAMTRGVTSQFYVTIVGGLVGKITKKNFSSNQIRQYLKQTKKISSALGIGSGGKTARRMWYMDSGITTSISTAFNELKELFSPMIKELLFEV